MKRSVFGLLALVLLADLLCAGCGGGSRRREENQDAPKKGSPGSVVRSGHSSVPGDFSLKIVCDNRSAAQPWNRIITMTSEGVVLLRENFTREHPRVEDIALTYRLDAAELYDIYAYAKECDFFGHQKYVIDESIDAGAVRLEMRSDGMHNIVVKSVKLSRPEEPFDRLCLKINQYLPAEGEIEAPFLADHDRPPKYLKQPLKKEVNIDLAVKAYLDEIDRLTMAERVRSYYCLGRLHAQKRDFVNAEKYAATFQMVGKKWEYEKLRKFIDEAKGGKKEPEKPGKDETRKGSKGEPEKGPVK